MSAVARRVTIASIALLVTACSSGGPAGSGASSSPTSAPSEAPSQAVASAATRIAERGTRRARARRPASRPRRRRSAPPAPTQPASSQVWVPAGTFTMGTDADAIAALEAQSPPPWVSHGVPERAAGPRGDPHVGLLARSDRGHERRVRGVRRRRRLHGPGELVRAGLGVAPATGGPHAPEACPGDGPDLPRRCISWYEAEAYATWRGGALPTRGAMGVRGARPRFDGLPVGRRVGSDARQRRRQHGRRGGRQLPDRGELGRRAGHVRQRHGVGRRLARRRLLRDEPGRGPDRPASVPATRSRRAAGGAATPFVARSAYRHYEDPPNYQDAHIGFRVVSQ